MVFNILENKYFLYTLIGCNIGLGLVNLIIYNKYFRKHYYRHFIKYEKKFYNLVRQYIDYKLKQKYIPTKGKRPLNSSQQSWKGFHPTIGHEVAILNLNSNLNVGSIYRSSCCLGVNKYHILGKKKYLPSSQVGYNFIPIIYHDVFPKFRDRNDESTLTKFNSDILDEFLSSKNYQIYLIEQNGSNMLDYDFTKKDDSKTDLIIFGNETHGIPDSLQKYIIKKYDAKVISVPQIGIGKSLNVSNCGSIVLYEYQRQHLLKIKD